MKHKSIIICILFFPFLLSCSDKNQIKLIEEDCRYLELLFTEASIDMSLSLIEQNTEPDAITKEIKNKYAKYASPQRMKNNPEGIDILGFAKAISESYYDFSKRKNGHAAVIANDTMFMPFEPELSFFSNLYFEKKDNNFYLYNDYSKKFKKGTIYTGDISCLYKSIINGRELYRYGERTTASIKKCTVSLNNKTIKIPAKLYLNRSEDQRKYSFSKYNDVIYLKIQTCNFPSEKEKDLYVKNATEIIDEFKNANTVIFDLRDNLGGNERYLTPFLYSLVYRNRDNNDEQEFKEYLNSLISNEKYLATETIKQKFTLENRNMHYVNRIRDNIDKKYIIETFPDISLKKEPWFEGKIVVIINPLTASAPEIFILYLKRVFSSQVIILGQNTVGAVEYPSRFVYRLPKSNIVMELSAADYTETKLLNDNVCWYGDTKGIYPDYWIFDNIYLPTLKYILNERNLNDFVLK